MRCVHTFGMMVQWVWETIVSNLRPVVLEHTALTTSIAPTTASPKFWMKYWLMPGLGKWCINKFLSWWFLNETLRSFGVVLVIFFLEFSWDFSSILAYLLLLAYILLSFYFSFYCCATVHLFRLHHFHTHTWIHRFNFQFTIQYSMPMTCIKLKWQNRHRIAVMGRVKAHVHSAQKWDWQMLRKTVRQANCECKLKNVAHLLACVNKCR